MTTNSISSENEKVDYKNEGEVETLDFPKHPLHSCWTLWYFENDKTIRWELNQREIASFQTVEDFWSLYNHIKPASELKQGTDYSLFKKGITPMWEDEANQKGGRWLISLDRRQRANELDKYWLDVILCLIGEAFDNSDEICGAVVNIRYKTDKIGIWTADAANSTAVLEIGRKLKERLHITLHTIFYEAHKDTKDKTGSNSKISYSC
ncbi:eukaryotic translation initiation factor 4E1-like [Cylas formicarius]|uniref:eukaryotic translation initiation factor 4E1-like n=1 Tax=Cylas formicarius TaxID=197179 RepID=UPI002958AD81|nr:eukaryotic translation initiation factor 4E1-like [Cylas formicarius]